MIRKTVIICRDPVCFPARDEIKCQSIQCHGMIRIRRSCYRCGCGGRPACSSYRCHSGCTRCCCCLNGSGDGCAVHRRCRCFRPAVVVRYCFCRFVFVRRCCYTVRKCHSRFGHGLGCLHDLRDLLCKVFVCNSNFRHFAL